MISRILTVCTGNICRSPVAEMALRSRLPERYEVSSAGLGALVGHDVDDDSRRAAEEAGQPVWAHAARQFTHGLAQPADLILVMDSGHRREILERHSQFSGKTFLMRHFLQDKEVPDPYRRGYAHHQHAVQLILEGADSWVQQLARMR